MMRIIFVDDEPNVLSGLRRMLRSKRNDWKMEFHERGEEALESMAADAPDVLVSDMRMPGMDGVQLLSAVKQTYPRAIRIALSGQTDPHMIYRCVDHAHQYLAKPCDADTLTETVHRAFALRELFEDPELVALVSKMSSLPSMPEQYSLIMEELQSEDPSLKKIGQIIESDVAMTAKVLQLVNSAFFGLAKHVSSPSQAAMFLGIETLKSLVVSTGIFSQFDQATIAKLKLDAVWPRSMRIGTLAKTIALEKTNDRMIADYAYMAGILADIGIIVLACNAPGQLERALRVSAESGQPGWQAEIDAIGHSHMEVGAYLVGLWGLPNPIVEAIAFHHRPRECVASEFSPLSAVHLAGAIVHADGAEDIAELDREYIETLGLTEEVSAFRSLCEAHSHE